MARPTRPHVRAARSGIATLEFIFVFPILLSIVAAIILIARADVHKIAVATAARNDAWQKRPDANPGDVLKLLNDPAQSEITGRSRSVVPRSSIFAGEFTADGRTTATGRPWDRKDLRFRPGQLHLVPHEAELALIVDSVPGLGAFLSTCHEHGVKVGPWRLQHVVPEFTFGEHPTYGAVTIAHWACKDGQPWKVGIGLFLGRANGKPKDLEVKLGVMSTEPVVVDLLILLRPEDDLAMTGKSKTLWQDAERRGKNVRLEAASLDGLAQLYSFPRWLAAVRESLPEGTPLPNLADLIQEKAEKVLEQVCMPVQG